MSLAARVTDMHTCPIPATVVLPPHIGGPIVQPVTSNVLIGGLPPAGAGGMCTCVGPPDTILPSTTGFRARVFVRGVAIAAMGDMTAHGGTIVSGCPTVFIGTGGMSMPEMPDMSKISDLTSDIADTTQKVFDDRAALQEKIDELDKGFGDEMLRVVYENDLKELDELIEDMDTPDLD